tara:strand:- start:9 stop:224 length:216 start_codon:yes stop_codon:yes gene_type:complete
MPIAASHALSMIEIMICAALSLGSISLDNHSFSELSRSIICSSYLSFVMYADATDFAPSLYYPINAYASYS